MTDAQPAVELKQVYFRYLSDWVLDDVSLTIEEGDFVGLVGPNGGGKTTLLRLVMGMLHPEAGSIRVFGKTPSRAVVSIGYVPQHMGLDRDFPIRVCEVVLSGRLSQSRWGIRYGREDRTHACEALAEVGMEAHWQDHFGSLSGGQRQRVLIARALANQPRLLIMDEPTSNVDSLSQQQIYDLLHRINQRCTLVLVSHDLGVVSSHVNKVACLNHRLVTHPTADVDGAVIQDLYGAHVHFVDHAHRQEEAAREAGQ